MGGVIAAVTDGELSHRKTSYEPQDAHPVAVVNVPAPAAYVGTRGLLPGLGVRRPAGSRLASADVDPAGGEVGGALADLARP